jgi:hypothetical protein
MLGRMGEPAGDEAAWNWAARVESYTGEVRVNLLRLVAIAGFYVNHLVTYYVLKPVDLTASFHLAATGVAVAWTLGAGVVHLFLLRRIVPPWLPFASVALDLTLTTVLVLLADGPASPLTALLVLIVASAALRVNLKAVWFATLGALASLALLYGVARWGKSPSVRPIPRPHQVIWVLAVGAAGLLAGQSVRQLRRLGLDMAQRVGPDPPPGPSP